MLLHLGAGYFHTSFNDHAPFLNFNPPLRSLRLSRRPPVPELHGIVRPARSAPSARQRVAFRALSAQFSGFGGMQNIGTIRSNPVAKLRREAQLQRESDMGQGRHTFKFGAELYLEQAYTGAFSGVTLDAVNAERASQPQQRSPSLRPPVSTDITWVSDSPVSCWATTPPSPRPQSEFTREGSQQWGLFAQDSWKVTRKLTVTYGARWDYATPEHEQYGRLGQLDPTLPNRQCRRCTGCRAVCQHLQLQLLQIGLSFRDRAAPGRGLSA